MRGLPAMSSPIDLPDLPELPAVADGEAVDPCGCSFATCSLEVVMFELRAEMKKGFDQISAKLVEDIKRLLLNENFPPLAISGNSALIRHSRPCFQDEAEEEEAEKKEEEEKEAKSTDGNESSSVKVSGFVQRLAKQSTPDFSADSLQSNAGLFQVYYSSEQPHGTPRPTGDTERSHGTIRPTGYTAYTETLDSHRGSQVVDWKSSLAELIEDHDHNILHMFQHKLHDFKKQHFHEQTSHERCLYRAVHSSFYSHACMIVIVANAVWMGYEADHRSISESGWRRSVTLSFNVWFIVELVLNITTLRRDFICGPDWHWNIFDTFLVLCSVPEFISVGVNATFFRVFRTARLTRSFRLVRLLRYRFFMSLREILLSVYLTLGSLFWSLVAMLFVAYVFSLGFMQSVGNDLERGVQFSTTITENFTSVLRTMLALFSVITGGQEWYPLVEEFREHGAWMAQIGMVCWVFFMMFGFMNVIVGVFCANAAETCDHYHELRISKEQEKQNKKILELMHIFREVDTEKCGLVRWDQFKAYAARPTERSILESHGIQHFALKQLWSSMVLYGDSDDDRVDITAFVMAFMRLSEAHVTSDLMLLGAKIKYLHDDVQKLFRELHCDSSPKSQRVYATRQSASSLFAL